MALTAAMTNVFGGITGFEREIKDGCYINGKPVEKRIERYFYRNGNVLSNVYIDNCLCSSNMVKHG